MTPTELELCARFLGEGCKSCGNEYIGQVEDGEWVHVLNPSELFMALLERAAELGLGPNLLRSGDAWCAMIDCTECHISAGDGPTPLSALTAAVAKYMEEKS